MLILCDNPAYANSFFNGGYSTPKIIDDTIKPLTTELFGSANLSMANCTDITGWTYGLLSEHAQKSQYDIVCNLARRNITVPDATFCAAGSGTKFHGQRDRTWHSPKGNIYLTVHFAPEKQIDGFGIAFPILAAVSVVQAIDTIPELTGRAGIKWVNDIFLDEKKVSGFLACNHYVQGAISSVTLGIGLNVLSAPQIEPTPYVPAATCLAAHCADTQHATPQHLLPILLNRLRENYEVILGGKYRQLLDIYRQGSIIIGREAEIISDPHDTNSRAEKIASGRISRIGDNLEIYFKNRTEPITHGRLILKD